MAQQTSAPSGRISLFDPAQLDASQQPFYDHVTTRVVPWSEKAHFKSATPDGQLLGPFNAMLLSPKVSQSLLALHDAEAATTVLSRRAREVVILSVGSVWEAAYEIYAHTAVARSVGFDEDAIRALVAGDPCDRAERR